MVELIIKKKATVLFLVLTTIFVVVLLATVALNIMFSLSRFTHHRASRIQAYYATLAGMNYAWENLRTGNWTFSPANSCPSPSGCVISDTDFPHVVVNREVRIILLTSGSANCTSPPSSTNCIRVTTNYTYTP